MEEICCSRCGAGLGLYYPKDKYQYEVFDDCEEPCDEAQIEDLESQIVDLEAEKERLEEEVQGKETEMQELEIAIADKESELEEIEIPA